MAENHIPCVAIRREITEEGRGKITLTLSKVVLDDFLSEAGAAIPADVSEEVLRRFCHHARMSSLMSILERAEEEKPGQTAVHIGEDDDHMAEFRSSDLGFDLMRRLLPAETEEMETLFDPQYSPVNVELGVFEERTDEAGVPQHIARPLLNVTLEPPSLA